MEKQTTPPKHWFWSFLRPGLGQLGSGLGRHLGEMGAHSHHLSVLCQHAHPHVGAAHAAALGAIGGPRPVRRLPVERGQETPEVEL